MIGEILSVIGLATHSAHSALIDVWATHIRDLTDVQERAVRADTLNGVSNLSRSPRPSASRQVRPR